MNRIFQGKIFDVEVLHGKAAQPLEDWESEVWQHHALFQDAVNYYLTALLALASESDNELTKIRRQITDPASPGYIWGKFSRRGLERCGLGHWIAPYVTTDAGALEGDSHCRVCSGRIQMPTFEQAATAILAGNPFADASEGRAILDAGLRQLLSRCTGSSGCRNAAPEFLPRFCKPDFGGNFVEDRAATVREADKALFPFVVHDPAIHPSSPSLQRFGVHSIALPNPKKPEFQGAEAVAKLGEMVDAWRERQPKAKADWDRLEATIGESAGDGLRIPGYAATSAKGEIKYQLFAMFLFRYVEQSDFTLGLLRSTTRPPKQGVKPPPENDSADAKDDPIRLTRGKRGYVFRAFTSLPCFGGDESGKPQWIEFDVAAFEEALKALHQVHEKGEERRKELKSKRNRWEYQRQRDWETGLPTQRKWKSTGGGEEDQTPPVLYGDLRISILEEKILPKLADSIESHFSDGEPKFTIRPRTIRSFRELRKKWLAELGGDLTYSDEKRERLLNVLRQQQKDEPELIGSELLFRTLLERENWTVWLEPTAEELNRWRKEAGLSSGAEFAKDPLQALADIEELEGEDGELKRLAEPIRLTPADPKHSRRQFYCSDVAKLTERGEYRHEPNQRTVIVPLAVKDNGIWRRKRVRLHYSAPRLLREGLRADEGENLAAMPWLQPMMAALNLPEPMPQDFRSCPVALMPEVTPSNEKRIYLNFPLTLDERSLIRQLGKSKSRKWDNYQFAGADGEFYWLRWPSTWAEKAKSYPWWESDEPFSCLAVDLGQRDSGAFALLEASAGSPPKPQSRRLGEAGGKTWWATVRATGVIRLPGEDALVFRDGKLQEELSGERGRCASAEEWEVARNICAELGFNPEKFLGIDAKKYSFPELNDQLLRALGRAQTRLARMQSWSCLKDERTNDKRKEAIKKEIQEAIAAAVEQDSDEYLPRWKELLISIKPQVEKWAWDLVVERLKAELIKDRENIPRQLERIADRVQPLRGRRWEWAQRDKSDNFYLRQTPPKCDPRPKLLAGQRGLSFERITQLENLRQRCQSLNRALQHEPGKKQERKKELPDPCPDLLDRLENLKEQRVNQTAHMILAQALGVRLKQHTNDAATRQKRDIHGEYERIPGRRPVDFIVIENLKYYDMTQTRSRRTNARLMKWCRRHLRDKLIELCEPYGIRVVEEWPADTSKFCSLTGVAGFRAVELTPDNRDDFRWRKHLERLADPERSKKLNKDERQESERVKGLFDALDRLNADLLKDRPARPKWRTLLAPVAGGPIFVPMKGKPMQADINAAINLGLRAIAAPENQDVHVRIRGKRDGDKFYVRAENRREKARWGKTPPEIVIPNEKHRAELMTEAHPLFFADTGNIAQFDRAEISGRKYFASSRGIRGTVNQKEWLRVGTLNNDRLEKAGMGRPLDEDDDVPM